MSAGNPNKRIRVSLMKKQRKRRLALFVTTSMSSLPANFEHVVIIFMCISPRVIKKLIISKPQFVSL